MRITLLLFFLLITQSLVANIDSTQYVVVNSIQFEGNSKTKEFVLLRELSFISGDTLLLTELDKRALRSNENLFNTSLFNKVSYQIILNNNQADIVYSLEERWYVWPYPILENGDRNFNTWWQTKDFNRLTYGVYLNWFNFRGRNETFKILMKVGFENQFSLGYDIPNLNKKKTLGLNVATGYAEYKEVNNRSVENKRIFYKSSDGPGRQVVFAKAKLTYRKSLNSRHSFGVRYDQVRVDTGVTSSSIDYLKSNQQESEFFTLSYYGKYDTRDYIDYPLKGYKIETYISKYGLGVFNNEGLNVLTSIVGLYWHKPLGGRWYFANSMVGKWSFFDSTPYSLQRGLGYANSIRGYELYVMDGERYGIIKTNIKFNLLKKREVHLSWLKVNEFNDPYFAMYLNAFFDAGYASDQLYGDLNLLSNRWAYGYGVGLDVTAFYDFVMRLEYSFNRENESGFFLHFKKAI